MSRYEVDITEAQSGGVHTFTIDPPLKVSAGDEIWVVSRYDQSLPAVSDLYDIADGMVRRKPVVMTHAATLTEVLL